MAIKTYPELPLLQESLINNTQNYYPNKFGDSAIGSNSNVNNVRVDLWEGPTGTYVFPTTPIQMQVVSTSANDTAAGTGARIVHIHYLDNNYAVQTTQVTLNGITPVNTTPTNILRINGFHVISVGSGGTSAGTISLQAVGGAVTYGIILAGFNHCRQAIYTIPAGKTGYITQWTASSGAATGTHFTRMDLRATTHYGILYPGVFLVQDEIGTLNNGIAINYDIPLVIPATADVKCSAISDSAAAAVVAMSRVDGWFE